MKHNRNISSITADDRNLIAGIVKHMGKSGTATIGNKKYKGSDLVAILQARIDAFDLVKQTRTAWRKATAEKDAKMAETNDLVAVVRAYFLAVYGDAADILEDFGLAPRPRKTSTVKTKYAAVTKAEATRARRRKAEDATPPSPIAPAHAPTTNGSPSNPT